MPSVTKPSSAVVTGDEAAEGEESSEPTLRWTDKPILVYVCEEAGCEDSEHFEKIVLKDEKVALATRAFRCVKMTPDQIDEDALLADEGKSVPRLIFIEPTKMKIDVVESKNLKAGKLFKSMRKNSKRFWKEDLKKVVGEHLDLLTKQDILSNAMSTLGGKLERAGDNEKKAEKVKAEMDETKAELAEITKKQVEIWKLTAKAA